MKRSQLKAGAAQREITPVNSQFLYGYPHVERYSTGVHDPLWSSALYLAGGDSGSRAMFIANDIIYITKDMKESVRSRVSRKTGIEPGNIMITATHTHSGPKTVDSVTHAADPAVPDCDREYVDFMQNRMVEAAVRAYNEARPARAGLVTADASGVGTNRRDPRGPADPEVPVLAVKGTDDEYIACMMVCSMHPTVLHEDSTLVSGDFPGMARLYLQENVVGKGCPVLHHTGPAGNQSPRHVTKGNTFEETQRLGEILGKSVEGALNGLVLESDVEILSRRLLLEDLPKRCFPSVEAAQKKLDGAVRKLASLREAGAPRAEVRTAECDWFGAERTLALAQAAADGRLEAARASCLPAEIQLLKVGKWNFVGWAGEIFVEYALKVKEQCPHTYVIAYANGLLNGYIVTEEAYEEGGYEASTAQFSWETGDVFVGKTKELVRGMG